MGVNYTTRKEKKNYTLMTVIIGSKIIRIYLPQKKKKEFTYHREFLTGHLST